MKFAIIETGGKQYRVALDSKLKIEKLPVASGAEVVFDKVLLMADGDQVEIGAPYIVGAKIEAKAEEQGRARKVIVFKYHSKTRQEKKRGHRQPYTRVRITKV